MRTVSMEKLGAAIELLRKVSVIARQVAESMTELADTAEDLVALWDDEQENGS